ncbi:hypothetical protein [Comamonas testosteroni]|jgi:hypothetical protein|uniref:hypothetical protein n=1 Tax=Comamonas testosteroni TaxID=285 RepID=UPI0026EB5113|nr:hypothetical protein [Comamonas testosteroni]
MNKKSVSISICIAFLVWAAIFFTQAAFGISYVWIMLTMFCISLPLSGWVARLITGVDPYKALFK